MGTGLYTEEIAAEIVERMTHGETLISICRQDRNGNHRFKGEFPNHSTVYDWGDPANPGHHPEFSPRFARAKLDQQRYWLEECRDIANTPELGEEEMREISSKNGLTVRTMRKDMLHHRMMKIDTNLKVIARMNPQLWAERLQVPPPQLPDSDQGPPRLIIEGGLPDDDSRPPDPPPATEE